MPIPIMSLVIMGLFPLLLTGLAKFGAPGFSNKQPRAWAEQLDGWRKRAYWAHLNAFEAFPLFASAVLIAIFRQVSPQTLNLCCLAYMGFRFVYTFAYLVDRDKIRTLSWIGALGCVLGLFRAAI